MKPCSARSGRCDPRLHPRLGRVLLGSHVDGLRGQDRHLLEASPVCTDCHVVWCQALERAVCRDEPWALAQQEWTGDKGRCWPEERPLAVQTLSWWLSAVALTAEVSRASLT